jgi:predicted alpha/beta superfamily hydrolase
MHPRIPHLRIVLGSLVLFACAPPAAATGPDTHAVEVDCARPAAATGPEILDIASAALGETRRVEVDLPASYAWATERRYPVLYLLDGQTHGGHAAASSEFLAAQGQLPELIVVSVHSTVRVRDFTQTDWPQAWVGGGGARHFTRFLEAELVPRIEREYRAAPFRILAGHSASGQYVLHQLATQPATFHAYLAMAPSLDWDGRLPIRELESALPRADRPARFAYFAYGDDLEQALADDLHLARALAAAAPGSLRAQVRAYPDETHSALPLLGVIDGLRALYAGYALPEGPGREGAVRRGRALRRAVRAARHAGRRAPSGAQRGRRPAAPQRARGRGDRGVRARGAREPELRERLAQPRRGAGPGRAPRGRPAGLPAGGGAGDPLRPARPRGLRAEPLEAAAEGRVRRDAPARTEHLRAARRPDTCPKGQANCALGMACVTAAYEVSRRRRRRPAASGGRQDRGSCARATRTRLQLSRGSSLAPLELADLVRHPLVPDVARGDRGERLGAGRTDQVPLDEQREQHLVRRAAARPSTIAACTVRCCAALSVRQCSESSATDCTSCAGSTSSFINSPTASGRLVARQALRRRSAQERVLRARVASHGRPRLRPVPLGQRRDQVRLLGRVARGLQGARQRTAAMASARGTRPLTDSAQT